MILGEAVKKCFLDNKKRALILFLLGVGVLFLVFGSFSDTKNEASSEQAGLSEYKKLLEAELEELCSSVDGVGKCRVTVSFERGEELKYKGNTLIESTPPRVLGICVVCRGADSYEVCKELTDMLSSLFDIGTNRVSVLKLN